MKKDRLAPDALLVSLAVLSSLFAVTSQNFLHRMHLVDEFYSISSGVMGLWFAYYCSFYIGKWWELRLATGSVSGSLTDIAMVVCGYFSSKEGEEFPYHDFSLLSSKLKLVHAYHACEVFSAGRIQDQTMDNMIKELLPSELELVKPTGMIPLLSNILSQITQMIEKHNLSDAIKFSILPSVQSSLSTIRCRTGDCSMILNCRYPKFLQNCMYFFILIHLVYLPMYIAVKGGTSEWASLITSLLGISLIAFFVLVLETHFKNPFKYNSFKFESIISSTFVTIDQLLGKTTDTKVTNAKKKKQ